MPPLHRKIFFVFSLLIVAPNLWAQNSADSVSVEVPEIVTKAFKSKYPSGKINIWLLSADHYEARFMMNDKITMAEFEKNGNWVYSETELTVDDVPVKSLDYIRDKYPGYEITFVTREENPYDKLLITRIEKENDAFDLVFDLKGNFLNQEGLEE